MLNKLNTLKNSIMLLWLTTMGCTYDVLPDEKDCTGTPEIRLVSTQDSQCGNSTGEIVVEVDGLDGAPFKFSINGEAENITGRFENLAAATYALKVETIEGCVNSLSVEIKNESGLNISIETITADCGSDNGEVTITPEGGEPPYQYKLNDGAFQSANTFEGLGAGDYTVFAQDAGGCSVSVGAEITPNVNFSGVQAIIQTNCVNASCHGGNVSPDFRQTANIINNAARIMARTQSKSMPPSSSGKSLTAQEIDEIACWVDSGANQ